MIIQREIIPFSYIETDMEIILVTNPNCVTGQFPEGMSILEYSAILSIMVGF
jgi:hypothetical protein